MHLLRIALLDKCKHSFWGITLTCIFFLFLSNTSSAQAPGLLDFSGKTIKDGKPLSGATVTVYRNGTIQQEQIKTGRNGKFDFSLAFGVDYRITFSYPGCVDMYLQVFTSKLPSSRNDIFPLYETEIPFFETTNTLVRISKYKNPFTKIIYDGKKAFKDDEAYLAAFLKDILIDPAEQAKELAAKEAREKAEKDKLEAAEKAKKDAAEKLRLETLAALLADAKAKQNAIDRAAELARLKEEGANKKEPNNETMETEAIRLQREKEAKNNVAKKNKEIKTNYENDLLKMVAENERLARERAFNKQKLDARTNTVITQMRREANVKGQADLLREEQKKKQKQILVNQQYKSNEIRKLVEAAAFAERSVRISKQTDLPDVKGYIKKAIPNCAVTVEEGIIKALRTTTVTQGKKLDVYRKETYFWGTIYYYKNNIEIEELTYNKEIAYYSLYKDK